MKIYFAGVEDLDDKTRAVNDAKAKNVFVSYYNLTESSNAAAQKQLLYVHKKLGIRSIIDCGAFTFMHLHKKVQSGSAIAGDSSEAKKIAGQGSKVLQLEAYLRNYISWLEKNWSLITYFIELDMQRMIGIEQVREWRKIFQKRGLGRKMWLVHHSGDSWEDFVRIIDESKVENGGSGMCAIEGKNMSKPEGFDYYRFAKYAYDNRVAIHAFASTRADFLSQIPVTSSDSTSWLQGTQYGTTVVFDPIRGGVISGSYNTAKSVRGKNKISIISNAWTKLMALDVTNDERLTAVEGNLVEAIKAFVKMEDHLTQMWEEKGFFWHEVERQNAEKIRKLYG
jgi:hypothetical protein